MKKVFSFLLAIIVLLVLAIIRTKKRCWSMKLSPNYALDLTVFNKIREFKDGVGVEPISFSWDRYKGDHNPQISLSSVLFNYTIFELNIYNVNHVEEDEDTDPTQSPNMKG